MGDRESYFNELYEPLDTLKPERVFLVKNRRSGQMAVKKLVPMQFKEIYEKLKRIECANIAAVYDVWDAKNGFIAVAQEYVRGETLEARLESGMELSCEEAVKIIKQLCTALTALHSLTPSIIHRDIKPSNVMLTTQGAVKLIDFDAAREYKPLEGKRSAVSRGVLDSEDDTVHMGTPGFAAPEQFGFGQSDVRSDIFALGVLLKTMLGERADARINAIVRKCTAMAPERRYKSAAALKNALSGAKRTRMYLTLAAGLAALAVAAAFILPSSNTVNTLTQGRTPAAQNNVSALAAEPTTAPVPTLTPTLTAAPTPKATLSPTPSPSVMPTPSPVPSATPEAAFAPGEFPEGTPDTEICNCYIDVLNTRLKSYYIVLEDDGKPVTMQFEADMRYDRSHCYIKDHSQELSELFNCNVSIPNPQELGIVADVTPTGLLTAYGPGLIHAGFCMIYRGYEYGKGQPFAILTKDTEELLVPLLKAAWREGCTCSILARKLKYKEITFYLTEDPPMTAQLRLDASDAYVRDGCTAQKHSNIGELLIFNCHSLNPDIVEVSPQGVLTIKGPGSAEIGTATTLNELEYGKRVVVTVVDMR